MWKEVLCWWWKVVLYFERSAFLMVKSIVQMKFTVNGDFFLFFSIPEDIFQKLFALHVPFERALIAHRHSLFSSLSPPFYWCVYICLEFVVVKGARMFFWNGLVLSSAPFELAPKHWSRAKCTRKCASHEYWQLESPHNTLSQTLYKNTKKYFKKKKVVNSAVTFVELSFRPW